MSVGRVVHEWSDKPFSYGLFDCCQFAAAVVEEQTGKNPMNAFSYDSKFGAYRIIRSYGSLKAAMLKVLGKPIAVDDAKHGDVLLIEADGQQLAGVVYLGRAVVRSRNGLIDMEQSSASAAWSVSCHK